MYLSDFLYRSSGVFGSYEAYTFKSRPRISVSERPVAISIFSLSDLGLREARPTKVVYEYAIKNVDASVKMPRTDAWGSRASVRKYFSYLF